jgi:hypothetical protein
MLGLQFASFAHKDPMGKPVGAPLDPPVPEVPVPPVDCETPPVLSAPPADGLPPFGERPPVEPPVLVRLPLPPIAPPVLEVPAPVPPPGTPDDPELPPYPNMIPPVSPALVVSVSSPHPERTIDQKRKDVPTIRNMDLLLHRTPAHVAEKRITAPFNLPPSEPPAELLHLALKRIAVGVAQIRKSEPRGRSVLAAGEPPPAERRRTAERGVSMER